MFTSRIRTLPSFTVRRCQGVSIPPAGLCQIVVVTGSTRRNSPMVMRMIAKIGWPIMRRSTRASNTAPIAAQQAIANSAAIQNGRPQVCSAW